MTNSQAKSELMQIYMSLSEEKKKALDVAFKAMEQAQADGEYDGVYISYDLISRQAVIEAIYDMEILKYRIDLEKVIKELPSVAIPPDHDGCKDCVYQDNPEDAMPCRECKQNYMDKWKAKANKTGHWKRISMDKYTTHAQYWYRCDRCGKDNLGNTDWCPNCGADMRGEQYG